MHRLSAIVLDVSNALQNGNFTIHERVFVIPPPYYLVLFEKSYPIINLDKYYDKFCLKCMNGIQAKKYHEDSIIYY